MNESNEQKIIQIKIPLADENLREELNFFKELRSFLREYEKPTEDIDFIIANIEADLEQFSQIREDMLAEEAIIAQLEKHPYFKNPGSYPVRLLTLLKYLKAKDLTCSIQESTCILTALFKSLRASKKWAKDCTKKHGEG